MTRICTLTIVGLSPYSQSRAHETPKKDKESHDAYEQRTWREKAHVDEAGQVFIPPMSLKFAIDTAAKRLSIGIPGKGKATYSKNFVSGVLCVDPVFFGLRKDDLLYERVYANSDGVRGSGKRVWRYFPIVPKGWKATAQLIVIDDEIPNDVIERCVREAGMLIGLGRFRPEKGGFLGRFEIKKFAWSEMNAAVAA